MKKVIKTKNKIHSSSVKYPSNTEFGKSVVDRFKSKYPKAYEVLGR